jgi:hypothetical protein
MATPFRASDPLSELLAREQTRVIECVQRFASGEGAAALSKARQIVRALADAEDTVLAPAFVRVVLRSEEQCLVDDARGERARQLTALDTLARKRGARLRKLAALELCDQLQHHANQCARLIPVLASQLPRLLFRAIAGAFATRYQAGLTPKHDAVDRHAVELLRVHEDGARVDATVVEAKRQGVAFDRVGTARTRRA